MDSDRYTLTDKAILEQVGRKLKEIRVEQNVSQQALAKASGISAFSISQMENGHNPTLLSIVMVLRALQRLDVLDVFFEEKPFSPIAYAEMMRRQHKRTRAYRSDDTPMAVAAESGDFNWDE
ncbi:MAG: helix-turn-helix transcriptional regulator [Bacteroidales bacterium]|nr:helix-turn-helix transcriptional regulator [Bacteroidales bacterium]